jgi:hypothetical protein
MYHYIQLPRLKNTSLLDIWLWFFFEAPFLESFYHPLPSPLKHKLNIDEKRRVGKFPHVAAAHQKYILKIT